MGALDTPPFFRYYAIMVVKPISGLTTIENIIKLCPIRTLHKIWDIALFRIEQH